MNVVLTMTSGDEAKTPTANQKIDFAASLMKNLYESHDDQVEQLIFTSSTAGGDEILGLNTLLPTSGQGTVGGIDASVETWWQNPSSTYVDETDIEAVFTSLWNTMSKGFAKQGLPKLLLMGATPYALFESVQQSIQRWGDQREVNRGFLALQFKNAPLIFSQYGGSNVYFLNPDFYKLKVSKSHYRKGDWDKVPGQNARYFQLYSMLQFVVTAKSRLGVAHL